MLTALGVLLFVVGLLFSIWWHELGHYLAAKKFGMRVSQFFVGFGPTAFSTQRGETEHGIKWIPLGGFIRIIGMIPPARKAATKRGGRISELISQVREQSQAEVLPTDGDRVFYAKPWWQRAITMLAGPLQNAILAAIIFTIVLTGFGVSQPSLTIQTVSECVLPSTTNADDCTTPVDAEGQVCSGSSSDCVLPPKSPAAEAGFEPGDTISQMNGDPVANWDVIRDHIRDAAGTPIEFTVERDGETLTLSLTPMANQVRADDDPEQIITVGYVGLAPTTEMTPLAFSEVPAYMGEVVTLAIDRLIALPSKVPQLIDATFGGAERDKEGPIGVVGVGRLSGEILALDQPAAERIAYFLSLVGSLNLMLFLFNLVPLYPLDGGHISSALYEGARNGIYRLRGRTPPGPVDTARMMPVAYVVALVFIVFSGLLVITDIVNPITLDG